MRFLRNVLYFLRNFGFLGLIRIIQARATCSEKIVTIKPPAVRFPIHLRCGTSDIRVFKQVFGNKEYDFPTSSEPGVIVDAGANIGLAAIFFANKFPQAKIFAIEPENSNYEILLTNTAPYENIVLIKAALWDKNEEINVCDSGYGKWGFMTERDVSDKSEYSRVSHKSQGITVNKILEVHSLSRIDIFKMDIEGAELELFISAASWIDKVDTLIVELHERMKPGCNRAFYMNTPGFDREWIQGENIYLSRTRVNSL